MRFDELVLKIPDDEIRVRFHPRMTVLSGLGAPERQALANTIVGALTGGSEETALRCVDGSGRIVIVLSGGGGVQARHDDGSGAAPVGELMSSPDALRDLILLRADDVTVVTQAASADEPRELREARASLAEITEQLETAMAEAQRAADLQARLDAVDEQLRTAEDGIARGIYAKVLADMEQLRAEAAVGADGPEGVAADRRLLTGGDAIHELAARWSEAAARLTDALATFGDTPRLDGAACSEAAKVAATLPADITLLADAVTTSEADRDALDARLHELTNGQLPTPSDPAVEELGVLDETALWSAAARVMTAREQERLVQLALGGLGAGDNGDGPTEINDMEDAHRDLEAAEQAAEAVRVPGVAGTGFGLAVALAGAVGAPLLIPFGMLIAASVGSFALLVPRRRVAHAAAIERAALDVTGAPTYLGFHLRRVNATMDPKLRKTAGAAAAERRAAAEAWASLAGPTVTVERALALEHEVRAYHEALMRLGAATQEIDQIRTDLAERAQPSVTQARAALSAACAAVGVSATDADDPSSVAARVTNAIEGGRTARHQIELETAEAAEHEIATNLGSQLDGFGVEAAPLPDRLHALEGAAKQAQQREQARAAARPSHEIDADLTKLQQEADRLRRPEWAEVTAADTDAPSIEELEDRRAELQCALAEARPSIDARRLADRHAALERRVTALVARHGAEEHSGDPGLVTDIQQHLLSRLGESAKAGPHGDPVPAVLDEVLERVPVDRKWDVLDHLYRVSEHHQLVYLSDDPFVAAWARQLANGSVTLLEPESEPV